jgi:hypothetical protein
MSKYLGWKSKESGTSAAPFKATLAKPVETMTAIKRVKAHVSAVKSKAKEAFNSTTAPQLMRAQTKESAAPARRGFLEVGGRFLEKAPGNNVASARVVLIQEGLGNTKDGYFYTKEALQSAAANKVFEGKKMYADHPSALDEQILPERSTRDIVGHYEDVAFEEAEDGSGMLTANLLLMRGDPYQWVHSLVERAVDYSKKYSDRQFIGLSINASGEAEAMDAAEFLDKVKIPESAKKKVEDAILEGLNQIKVVSDIHDAVSVDLVTEAGAKGKILELLEAQKHMTKEAKKLKEAEEAKKKEEECKASEGEDGEGGHDDEAADKELIMKMLKKQGLVGDDASEEDVSEAMEMGGHYMKAAKAQGHEGEEAAHHACAAMKMAADVHGAMNPKKDKEAPAKDDEAEEKEHKETHKESAMVEIKAELARLREENRQIKIEKHLDKKMKESGLPSHVTKLFKEAVDGLKSEKEIDKAFETFSKVYKLDRSENFVESVEKTTRSIQTKDAVSFDDCVAEEI